MADEYLQQHRGDDGAYERYLQGMDRSMRQKVALTAAHLLAEGRVADMGMGSGSGTLALASLYPRLKVVGVDVNPEMVERARRKYTLPNLEFVAGDVARPVFAEGSLDGIFDSSVLHHVTSFTGYDHEAAARALAAQAAQLGPGGSLIVRDFVAPESGDVLLDLPADDGDDTDEPLSCSSARLFERLAREFRPLSAAPGFSFQALENAAGLHAGWRRFRVDQRLAAEFLLRKDYRADWASEVLEEYTYYTSVASSPSTPRSACGCWRRFRFTIRGSSSIVFRVAPSCARSTGRRCLFRPPTCSSWARRWGPSRACVSRPDPSAPPTAF